MKTRNKDCRLSKSGTEAVLFITDKKTNLAIASKKFKATEKLPTIDDLRWGLEIPLKMAIAIRRELVEWKRFMSWYHFA
jgi:hypothetical protein